jgi:large subunit ribosomal protein L24
MQDKAKQSKVGRSKMRRSKKVRSGDTVKVVAGNAKGQMGTVLSCTNNRVVIRGVNTCKKHVKRSEQHPQGGTIEVERSIHISNVCPCDAEGKLLKVKVQVDENGDKGLVYQTENGPSLWRSMKQITK